MFLQTHLDAAQLVQLEALWQSHQLKVQEAQRHFLGAQAQVVCVCGGGRAGQGGAGGPEKLD